MMNIIIPSQLTKYIVKIELCVRLLFRSLKHVFVFTETLWMVVIFFTLPHRTYSMICPASCMCSSAGKVECVGLTITDVPRPLPVQTNRLELDKTNMNVINEHSLANLTLLLRFSLTRSHLHTIHPRAFHAAQQLKSIKLSFNQDLPTLPVGVFSSLTSLEQLQLDGNKLYNITSDMFDGLVGLLVLDLSRNGLTHLTPGVFDMMTNLTFLTLARNFIKTLPPNIFHSLTNLRRLVLHDNNLEVLEPGIFDALVNLVDLKIYSNKIASLPPQIFWPLRNLHNLSLSSNQLQEVPNRTFYHMPKMTKLTIYDNPLSSLPDELMGHMPNIAEFYLFGTNLITVPGNLFTNMSGLVSLKFHLNDRLSDLPPDLFCCLPFLRNLSLKSNSLHHLHPQQFSNLTTLDTLFLSDNMLENLPENIFYGLRGLRSVYLNNNLLKTLPGEIFSSNDALNNVKLSGNPWNCTCSIRDIARWIRLNEHVVLDRVEVICHSPVYQLLRPISSLHDEEFSFCDDDKQQLHKSSTYGPTTLVSSTNTPLKITTLLTTKKTNQHDSFSTETSSVMLVTSTTKSTSTYTETFNTAHSTEDDGMSPPFYDNLVIEEGPNFVHHNIYESWVYVWFLPSSADFVGLLMFSHILLVVTGLLLILGTMYTMCKLGKIMDDVKTEIIQIQRR
ncbi:leucine-rich repeat-containing protein 15-like [Gouania willdenowi]|uniref:leucine-rich repeat-containing protein 15-like n=1 Tax=Gouania willdenowi TaxID=441366 RepID=UPI001054B8DE|nr:leucine-rich repeat-containing protein 15-like [Gouania willdenowi]